MGSSPEAGGSSLRWVGGFNPFATYDLLIDHAKGDGSTGMTFLHSANRDSLTASVRFKDGKPESVTWTVFAGDKQVIEEKWPVPPETATKDLTLRAQMSAVGVNLFLESAGRSELIGYSDFSQHFDLRERKRIQQIDFGIRTDLKPGAQVLLTGASILPLARFRPG